MDLYEALPLDLLYNPLVCFVGGGGKTSAMFRLAAELKQRGKKVLVTTTTRIAMPAPGSYDFFFVQNEPEDLLFLPGREEIPSKGGEIVVAVKGFYKDKEKLIGYSAPQIDFLFAAGKFDWVLVEGDGSQGKPVKAPGEHEPVVPGKTGIFVAVTGMDCLGEVIGDKIVHRPRNFMDITGGNLGDVIDEPLLLALIESRQGLFKGAPAGSLMYWMLNKADDADTVKRGVELAEFCLKRYNGPLNVLITSLFCNDPVRKVM